MPNPPTQLQVKAFLVAALECSYYVAPQEPGLTHQELFEVGKSLGLQPGEIGDALHEVADVYMGMRADERLLPSKTGALVHWQYFIQREEPEYRDIRAFDFVYSEWRDSARTHGAGSVRLDHSVLVERAVAAGLPRLAIETAIAILVSGEVFLENNGILQPKSTHGDITLPSENLRKNNIPQVGRSPARAAAFPIVKDVIARRADERASSVEPLNAFADELERLGYGSFRLWWNQIVSEYNQAARQTAPVTVTVLAAALVEGALTFVVKHARSMQLQVFRSDDFDGEPRSWKLEKLIASAASGGKTAILDQPTKHRAEGLSRTRQRIHAGRMLSDFPSGPIDLKPEEARDAVTTAELVVGRVIEWLHKYPLASA